MPGPRCGWCEVWFVGRGGPKVPGVGSDVWEEEVVGCRVPGVAGVGVWCVGGAPKVPGAWCGVWCVGRGPKVSVVPDVGSGVWEE